MCYQMKYQCTISSWIRFTNAMADMNEVSLPWKEYQPLLTENYKVAVSCLNCVLKCLRRNPELFTEYNRIEDKQSSKGIISEVDPCAEVKVGHLHYLPHHPRR